MSNEFERIIRFVGNAFDKTQETPNYGIGSPSCLFVLKGKEGAITFEFSTGWYLKETYDRWEREGGGLKYKTHTGYGVYYHVPERTGEFDTEHESCPWLDGKTCYQDGSMILSDDALKILIEEGEDAVWVKLEEIYKDWVIGGNDELTK